jgi:hypothetical protein
MRCPICQQEGGYHATVFHFYMPAEEQARRVWFSEEEAIAWLRRRLQEIEEQ